VRRRRELPLTRVGAVDEVVDALPELVADGDLLLVMGAGDVGRLGGLLKARYTEVAA